MQLVIGNAVKDLNPFTVGGCVKNTNALFYCYFLTVSCHSERSEESDNVCFIFLLTSTDSSLRSE